jgi:hypothetical protein
MTPARQLVEQSLGFLQIARVEPLRKPPVNRRKQPVSLLRLTLVTPEARVAHCGAEFPGFGLLLAGDGEGALKVRFRFRAIVLWSHQGDFADNAINLSLEPCFFGGFSCVNGFADAALSVVELAKVCIGFGQIR